ncbi:uncharacterized protein DNG_03096 [Cephalotrichum gorgonifer]|uniref:ubiquitinyl hydrolase 1 n=1 Tax=Cephalotrichum gorgonifer TaxID=2041049 RepID=A0AAE8MTL2_9PEZI|nr:uncharacterized protein DNG_03096 [Cephalotrichum gorgonifer]
MFQPQPTPYAASCFNSYGVTDFSFPLALQNLPGASSSAPNSGGSTSSGSGSPPSASAGAGAGSAPGVAPPRRHVNHHPPGTHSHSHSHPQHQHQHQNQLRHQQHPHQQSLLYSASASASASASVSPVDSSHGHFSPASSHSHSHSHSHINSPYDATPATKMEQHESQGIMGDELAAQEAAAREYQPRLEGPLVGERISSSAISEEYAKADPIYVEKTLALPNVYSHYRPIQGDGNCGWRAIGFSYFETLIRSGDRNKVEGEVARITSLNQVLLTVGGYDRFLFEEMVEETVTLLRDIAASMSNPQAAVAILTERFNDRDASNAIIYHLRLLAASWLKGDPAPYEPFIPEGLGIAGYCSDVIQRVDCEIEQLGIMLLVNVLLKPIGFVLEIAYLDRSPGSQVNVYRFPDEANSPDAPPDAPVIYLLFRPDHYDILYRTPVTLQINRATGFTHQHDIEAHRQLESFTSVDYAPLAMLPSFSYAPGSMGAGGLQSESLASGMAADFVSLSQQRPQPQQAQWMPQGFADAMPPSAVSQPLPPQAPSPTETTSLPSRPAPSPAPATAVTPAAVVAPVAAIQNSYPLRFSPQCYKLEGSTFPEPNFTTAMFKNSHYNKAHYNNPNFHPEEWAPDEEFGGRGRRRKHEG